MALILTYLINSFYNPLPWSECRDEWPNCIPSGGNKSTTPIEDEKAFSLINTNTTNYYKHLQRATPISSSEYYFV